MIFKLEATPEPTSSQQAGKVESNRVKREGAVMHMKHRPRCAQLLTSVQCNVPTNEDHRPDHATNLQASLNLSEACCRNGILEQHLVLALKPLLR